MSSESILRKILLSGLVFVLIGSSSLFCYFGTDLYHELSKEQVAEVVAVEGDGVYISRPVDGEQTTISDPEVGTPIYCNDGICISSGVVKDDSSVTIRHIKTGEEVTLDQPGGCIALNLVQQANYFDMQASGAGYEKYYGFSCIEAKTDNSPDLSIPEIPEPEDYDEDGIEDSRDMCKLSKGPESHFGCPAIGIKPGGLLLRPGLAAYLTLSDHGHAGMYLGDYEVGRSYAVRQPLLVYRYDENSEKYSAVNLNPGDRLQKADIIKDCVAEVNGGSNSGAMFSNINNFKDESKWAGYRDVLSWDNIGVTMMSRDLSESDARTAIGHMVMLIGKTDAGDFVYSLTKTGPLVDEDSGRTKYYYSCVTSFEAAYEKIDGKGVIPNDYQENKWLPISPNELYYFYQKQESGQSVKIFKMYVECPVQMNALIDGKVTGYEGGQIRHEIPNSQYIVLSDGSKMLSVFDPAHDPTGSVIATEDGDFRLSTLESYSNDESVGKLIRYPKVGTSSGDEYSVDFGKDAEDEVLIGGDSHILPESFDEVDLVPPEPGFTLDIEIPKINDVPDASDIEGIGDGCAIPTALIGAIGLCMIFMRR
jgi:hypothetical protein